jgi:hypothetical protein
VPFFIPSGVAAIMNDCLVEDTAGRPTFDEISNGFNRFTPQAVEPTNFIKKMKPGEKNFEVLLKMFPRHIAEPFEMVETPSAQSRNHRRRLGEDTFCLYVCVCVFLRSVVFSPTDD